MIVDYSSGFTMLPMPCVLTIPLWIFPHLPQAPGLASACALAAEFCVMSVLAGVSVPEPALWFLLTQSESCNLKIDHK